MTPEEMAKRYLAKHPHLLEVVAETIKKNAENHAEWITQKVAEEIRTEAQIAKRWRRGLPILRAIVRQQRTARYERYVKRRNKFR